MVLETSRIRIGVFIIENYKANPDATCKKVLSTTNSSQLMRGCSATNFGVQNMPSSSEGCSAICTGNSSATKLANAA